MLIEKINTSVSWFTVHMPPVIHLSVSHVRAFMSKYKLIHLEQLQNAESFFFLSGFIDALVSSQFTGNGQFQFDVA